MHTPYWELNLQNSNNLPHSTTRPKGLVYVALGARTLGVHAFRVRCNKTYAQKIFDPLSILRRYAVTCIAQYSYFIFYSNMFNCISSKFSSETTKIFTLYNIITKKIYTKFYYAKLSRIQLF